MRSAADPIPVYDVTGQRGEVLLVDDSPEELRVLSQLLSREGYRVRVAAGGVEGIESAHLCPPDLVLLDVLMPEMDGYEVCEALKRDPLTAGVPVLFLSGLTSGEDQARAFETGAEDYLTKPFRAAEVLARVRAHLGRRRAEAALRESNERLKEQLAEIECLQARLRQQVEEEIHRRAALTRALLDTAARLSSVLDLSTVTATVCEEASRALEVDAAAVLLLDSFAAQYRAVAVLGARPDQIERALPPPSELTEAAARRDPLFVPWVDGPAEPPAPSRLGSMVIAGMARSREPIGALVAAVVGRERDFSEGELALLQGLADQAAQAVANARLYDEVRRGREQLRALSLRLIETQESERRTVARELHDEIGQVLTWLKLTLGKGRRLPPGPVVSELAEARGIADELLRKVRNISLDLRPSMLDDHGLLPALLSLFDRHAAHAGLRVAFDRVGLDGVRFDPRVETAAYRIVQEALTNVVRHAGVQEAEVGVWADDDMLRIEVADRGAGFRPEEVSARHAANGLEGIRDRAELLGGALRIESALREGTTLSVELPLRS